MTDNMNQLNDLKEGAELNLAFKTEPGRKIEEAAITVLADLLEEVVATQEISKEDSQRMIDECRGISKAFRIVGDKIHYATAMVARRVVKGQLGQTR